VLVAERPAIGTTTVARRLTALLREAGVQLAGFVTEELRERSRRVGFAVETFDGARGVRMGYRHESLRCCGHYP
jgi:nucleoside-triphosphatase